MSDIMIEKINLSSSERKEVEAFLEDFDLLLDEDVEYTIVARIDDKIVGTCSYSGNILKCFAVDESLQGEGIASKLMTHITNVMFEKGIFETFIFTKPKNKTLFEGLGYRTVYEVQDVALLEGLMSNAAKFTQNMLKKSSLLGGEKAALVMNCNPFTLGHRYLIERAAKENKEVVVFIVEENRSVFPFDVRINLVKRGVEDLKNVTVIPGGKYIISSATFPSYFLKREDERLEAYTTLDAGIFGKYIATIFNIKKRYVGTEPFCNVTNKYNEALIKVLPRYGVEIKLIERLVIDGTPVSASEVRRLIGQNSMDKVRKLVPDVTWEYLNSDEAKDIIKNIHQ